MIRFGLIVSNLTTRQIFCQILFFYSKKGQKSFAKKNRSRVRVRCGIFEICECPKISVNFHKMGIGWNYLISNVFLKTFLKVAFPTNGIQKHF